MINTLNTILEVLFSSPAGTEEAFAVAAAAVAAKIGLKAAVKAGTKVAVKAGTKAAVKAGTKAAVKGGTKAAVKGGTKAAVKGAVKSGTKGAVKKGAKGAAKIGLKSLTGGGGGGKGAGGKAEGEKGSGGKATTKIAKGMAKRDDKKAEKKSAKQKSKGGGLKRLMDKPGKIAGAPMAMVTGLGQMISGAIKKKQAEKMKPGMEDPDQRAALEATQQRMKSSYAGTDATTAANMRAIDQGTRQTQQAISKNTGGNVGGTMSALLQSQRTGAGQANQAFAGAAQRGSHFQGLGDMMQSRISQRKLELGMLDYQQKMGEAMENKKAGFGNLMQGVQSSMGQTGKGPDLSAMSYKPTTVSNTATPYQPVMGGMSTQIQGRPSVTGMQPSQQQGQVNTGAIPNYNSAANSMSFGQPQQAPNSSGAGIQQSPPIQAPNYGKPNPIKVGGNPSNNGAMNYQADDDEKKEEQAYRVGMNDVKQ